ncbi:hypothetical protein HNV11_18780 [Spirosoma taeanense]|uniref:Uncharacterized protein n=1 Tax=Spirosoma taeanense TaxID=2735870 RepID=A0A6M5YCH4_9BACT|nr:hypothetical protein [Spirosoma taeanense]QJW91274.1 hypothetical protein HNV11_18780 [Spirosoma taeanense]
MERILSSLLAGLCAAPLFYFATAWLFVIFNQNSSGPDDRLAVAYGSTFGGFAAMIAGFFLVWWLTYRFLLPHYLRIVQLIDGIALIGWVIVYMNYAGEQPQRLDYGDRRPVLEVELRATKAMLGSSKIDSILSLDFSGGSDNGYPHLEQLREEADAVILPWEIAPIDVRRWEIRVFLQNQPMLFPLNLPRRPTQATDWSGWLMPVQYQDYDLPEEARQGLSLRYRFQLIPYGQ